MRQNPLRCAILALLILASETSAAGPTAPIPAAGPFTAAKACVRCHQPIYNYWLESAHAQAASRPSYLEALNTAVEGAADKDAVRQDCLSCHAPTTLLTRDYALEQPITREGITCDFCHTVADVDLDKPGHPFELKPGKVKRGSLLYAKSSFHETEYSTLHKTSPLLCAACHEYRNALGALVLSSYSEWKQSPYASRGVPCQECHMPLVPGSTVREGLQSTQRVVNLHRLMGTTRAGELKRGLELRIDSLDGMSLSADVQVTVTNTGVGHGAPGGHKSLVLAVGVETPADKMMHRRERIYRRELKDAEGRTLVTVPDMFLKAASVGEDTRIMPKESRTERFTVPLPEGSLAIVARLEYWDNSDPKAGPRTTVVAEERRELKSR